MGERGSAKTLGITVMPEWIQVEGIDALLDNLQGRAGATAIATSPYVMEPADKATGGREPPIGEPLFCGCTDNKSQLLCFRDKVNLGFCRGNRLRSPRARHRARCVAFPD